MNPLEQHLRAESRRQFLLKSGNGLGATALSTLLNPNLFGSSAGAATAQNGGLPGFPNIAPKAKRLIYLFFSGGPSHIDMFDFKPEVRKIQKQLAQLEGIIFDQNMVRAVIVDQAAYPPVAPKPTKGRRLIVIGLLFGLMMGIIQLKPI